MFSKRIILTITHMQHYTRMVILRSLGFLALSDKKSTNVFLFVGQEVTSLNLRILNRRRETKFLFDPLKTVVFIVFLKVFEDPSQICRNIAIKVS